MIVHVFLALLGGFSLLEPKWVHSAEMILDCPFDANGQPSYIRTGETVPCTCEFSDSTNPLAVVKWYHPNGEVLAEGSHEATVNFGYNPDWYECDSGWTFYPEAGTCLRSFVQRFNWTSARAECQQLNGDLVKITDAAFMRFVLNNMNNGSRQGQWIGLHDADSDGTFHWLDETTPLSYEAWAAHRPDNRGGNERCGEISIYYGALWNDVGCGKPLFYICQKAPAYSDNQNREYTCKATSAVSGATVMTYTPRYATGPHNVTVNVTEVVYDLLVDTDPINVQCEVDKDRTHPKPNVTIQGVDINPILPDSENETQSSWIFNFNVQPLSGNNYTAKCVAEIVGADTVEAEFNLTVWGPPNVRLSGCPFKDDGTTPAYVLASASRMCGCTKTDSGMPEGEAVWFTNSGTEVSANNPTATFTISPSDNGVTYKCVGKNENGQGDPVTYTARVASGPTAVTAGPLSLSLFQFSLATIGTGVALTCDVSTGSFVPEISVTIEMSSGLTLQPDGPFQTVTGNRRYSFTYEPTDLGNATAQCVASNTEFPDDLKQTQSIAIGTLGGQMVATIPPTPSIIEGNSTTFGFKFVSCFGNSATPSFIWKLNGNVLDTSTGPFGSTETTEREETMTSCTAEHKDVKLEISEFRPEHLGDYECELTLSSTVIAKGFLHINDSDVQLFPTADISPKTVNTTTGTNVTFSCLVSRATQAKFTVTKLESPILTPESFELEEVSTSKGLSLTITTDISMTVACVASNDFETVESQAVVTIDQNDTTTTGEKTLCVGLTDNQGTLWPSIYPGIVRTPCTSDYLGLASRYCKAGGVWDSPSYAACVLKEVELVNSTATEILTIVNITETTTSSDDLSTTIDIMGNLSRVLESNVEDGDSDIVIDQNTLEIFTGVTNNLLNANEEVWENADKDNKTTEPKSPLATLMATMDSFVKLSLKETNIDDTPIVLENIAVKRKRLERPADIEFPSAADEAHYKKKSEWVLKTRMKAFLPAVAFESQAQGKGIGYAVMLFKNVKELLGTTTEIKTENTNAKLEVVSEILSFSLGSGIKRLDSPLRLEFRPPLENYTSPRCVYLKTEGVTIPVWSSEKCSTDSDATGTVHCSCNHLTSFTVLMSPFTESDQKALDLIVKVGCGIDIAFLTLTLIVHAFLWSHVKGERSILHVCICVSLIVVYITFIFGIDGIDKESTCLLSAVVIHYFLLLVFSLLLAEGLELYLQVTVAFSRKTLGKKLIIPPFIVCAIVVAVAIGSTWDDSYLSNDFCWLNPTGAVWSFLGPAILVVLINMLITFLVLRVVLSTHILIHQKYKDRAKDILKAICVLTPWLALTWLFGLLAITKDDRVFAYLATVFNALQGFLVFVFYCLASHEIRFAFKEKTQTSRSGY